MGIRISMTYGALGKSRGCGMKQIGSSYFISEGFTMNCDRLNLNLIDCPVCGLRHKFSRGIAKIDFQQMFGEHKPKKRECQCGENCYICKPRDVPYFLMFAGHEYYTQGSFIKETKEMGVSKALSMIPKGFVFGESPILLAMKSIGTEVIANSMKGEVKCNAIFYGFIPTAIQHLITEEQHQDEEFMKALENKFKTMLGDQYKKTKIVVKVIPKGKESIHTGGAKARKLKRSKKRSKDDTLIEQFTDIEITEEDIEKEVERIETVIEEGKKLYPGDMETALDELERER